MKNMRSLCKVLCASIAGLLLAGLAFSPSWAGNPRIVDPGSGPTIWQNGVAPYNLDQGPLGVLDEATITQMVVDGFAAWEAVPSSTLTVLNNGPILLDGVPIDVTFANFMEILFVQDGQSPVIYDDEGLILDALGFSRGVAGVSFVEFFAPDGIHYLENAIVLDGSDVDESGPFTPVGWAGLVVHEQGHHVGLGHSVVNGQAFFFGDPIIGLLDPPPVASLETMYPFIHVNNSAQASPHADDIGILSSLYPEPAFTANAGTIEGTIFNADLVTPLVGANVTVRNLSAPYLDAIASISGSFGFFGGSLGAYSATGLTAGQGYTVAISDIFQGGFSSIVTSPLPGPDEFYNGADESNDPDRDIETDFVAVVAQAGVPVSGIDILINSASSVRILTDPSALDPPDDGAVSGFAVPPEIDIRRVDARFDDTDADGSLDTLFVNIDVVGPLGARNSVFRFQLDFGEPQRSRRSRFLSLKDQTMEPGTEGRTTADVTLELKFAPQGAVFSGLPTLADRSTFDTAARVVSFVASVDEIFAGATQEQLDAANNFDGTFTFLGFTHSMLRNKVDRVPDTNDNDDPSIVQETSRFTFTPFPIIQTHLGSVPRGTLIGIDESTGRAISIGNTGFSSFSDLALSEDGRLFGSLGFGGDGGLIEIDPNTGSSFFVGPSGFPTLPALDFAPPGSVWDGSLIGVGSDLLGENVILLVINTVTGEGSPIGPINVPFVDCIVFTDDGRLFGTGFVDDQSVLIEIDPVTGAGQIIAPIPAFTVVGLEVASDGSLIGSVGGLGPQPGAIVRIDTATGATTLIGPTGFTPVSGLTRLP